MARAAVAKWSKTRDMWPADNLASWRDAPLEAFPKLLAEHHILFDRDFRSTSVRTYTAMLSWWCDKLAERRLSLLEATPADAFEIFDQEDFELVSRRRYLQLIDRVYDYIASIGWTGRNPMKSVLMKERELVVDLPPGLSNEQLEQLIERLKLMPGWKGARDRAASALLIGAGLRANELIRLQHKDLLPDYGIQVEKIEVHAARQTIVLPGGPWRAWLDNWLDMFGELRIPAHLVCPATRAGKGYSPSGLFRRVSHWLEPFGELPQSGPNMLRNTFARKALTSRLYRIQQVQAFLGHVEDRATHRHVEAMGLRVDDEGWVLC